MDRGEGGHQAALGLKKLERCHPYALCSRDAESSETEP